MNLLDLPKLRSNHWRNGGLVVLATIAPGALIILLFRPDLFAAADIGKVILLSLGITLPVVAASVCPALPHMMVDDMPEPESKEFPTYLLVACCVVAAFALYAGIAVSFLFRLTFRQFWLVVAAVEALAFAFGLLRGWPRSGVQAR
jgi:hypothetical protein